MKAIPMGIYGCPSCPVAKSAVSGLTAAIGRVIDPQAAPHRAQALVFATTHPRVVLPAAHIFAVRLLALRRTWWLFPALRGVCIELLGFWFGKGHPSLCTDEGGPSDAQQDGVVCDVSEGKAMGP
eukprot:5153000-Alexandrium_andersonii.AAC.1